MPAPTNGLIKFCSVLPWEAVPGAADAEPPPPPPIFSCPTTASALEETTQRRTSEGLGAGTVVSSVPPRVSSACVFPSSLRVRLLVVPCVVAPRLLRCVTNRSPVLTAEQSNSLRTDRPTQRKTDRGVRSQKAAGLFSFMAQTIGRADSPLASGNHPQQSFNVILLWNASNQRRSQECFFCSKCFTPTARWPSRGRRGNACRACPPVDRRAP